MEARDRHLQQRLAAGNCHTLTIPTRPGLGYDLYRRLDLSWKREAAIFAVCGLLIALYFFNLRQRSPNRDGAKLNEVQQLSYEAPVYPDFTEVGSNLKSSYTVVDLTKHYRSSANFDDVKKFYQSSLQRDGWTLIAAGVGGGTESRELRFKKGQFTISIFHTRSSSVYDYAIDFVWDDVG